MDDLDRQIDQADADYAQSIATAGRDAARLVALLTERITHRIRKEEIFADATEIRVDSDFNLDVITTPVASYSDSDFLLEFEDVAELIRDDLLHLAETGQFSEDKRTLTLTPPTPTGRS